MAEITNFDSMKLGSSENIHLPDTEGLLKSQAFQYKILANIGDVIVIIDDKGINKFKSPNIEKLFGWKPEDVVGRSTFENVHPDDVHAAQKFLGELAEEPIVARSMECRYRCKDGGYKWIEFTGINLYDDPDIRGILGNYRDITERKQFEESIRENEETYRMLYESINDAFFTSEVNDDGKVGNFMFVNDAACQRLGYTREELLLKNPTDINSPNAKPLLGEIISKLHDTKRAIIESEHVTKDGRIIPVEISTHLTRFKNKTVFHSIARDITERKRAEEEIKRNETRLKKIVDVLQYRSENTQDFLNYALDQVIDLTSSKIGYIYHYDEARKTFILNSWSKDVMDECAVANPSTCYELDKTGIWGEAVRQRRPIIVNDFTESNSLKKGYPAGHVHLSKFMTVPIFKDDRIVGVVGVANKETNYDTTDILQTSLMMETVWNVVDANDAQEASRQSEERYAVTIAAVDDGIWDWNVPTGDAVFSAGYYAILGYEPDGFPATYTAWRALIHAEDVDRVEQNLKQSLTTGLGFSIDLRMKMKSGEWRWVSSRGKTVGKDAFGNAIRMVGTLSDITERKQAEEERKNSLALLETILNATDNGILVVDRKGRVLKSNSRFIEMWNIAAEILVEGDDEKMLMQILDQLSDPEEFLGKVRDLYSEPESVSFDHLHFKDGRVYERNSHPMFLSGEPIGRTWSFRDITDRVRAEENLQKISARLRQSEKMEAIGQLAGGIAHDFNNVLGGIIGFTDLSLNYAERGSLLEKNLLSVLKASDRAKNLVKQILAFSRQSNPQKRITSLRPIIEEVMDLLQSSIPSSVIIESDINTNLKPVMADPTQLHQALLNLATNAVHAMNRKGTLTFRLFAATLSRIENGRAGDMAAGEYAVIEVKDSGCGMDAATLSKAFEPFFTTKKVGEGTGMGLSVVLGIVQEHGGDIQVESEVGKGTIITIYLPTIDAREASTADEKLFPVSGTERILFVDDEQMLVDMNNDWLTSLGYTVTAVTNSQEALLVLKEKSAGFDLLVTDQTMPGITGIELAKEALQLWKDLPIILCTGFSNEVNRESAEAHGISKFIMKPYRSHEISYAIREVLDGKKK